MPVDYEALMAMPPWEVKHRYTARDTMLYALGVGAGSVLDQHPHELRFVYEQGLAALPTFAAVVTYPGFWQKDAGRYGITWQKLLHGEQSIILHRPLPPEGDLTGTVHVEEVYDKGADKGALLSVVREMHDADGSHVATVRSVSFLRADGGFGGSGAKAPAPHPIPDRAPDIVIDLPTRPEQAMLYRLSGDYNPLHIDPAVATVAGFPRPILHGLCTYGVAGRALVAALCPEEPGNLRRIDARFSAPVFPGETIRTQIWRDSEGRASFRASVVERDKVVLDNGRADHV